MNNSILDIILLGGNLQTITPQQKASIDIYSLGIILLEIHFLTIFQKEDISEKFIEKKL